MYTLAVIDMQAMFEAGCRKKDASRHNETVTNIKANIQKAIEDKAFILFVEYDDCGPTNTELTNLTKGYDRVAVINKSDDNGSREIEQAIWKNKAPKRRIKVCGVNTECCVCETVVGLSYKLQHSVIEVLAKSCNSSMDHYIGIVDMDKEPNVFINRE